MAERKTVKMISQEKFPNLTVNAYLLILDLQGVVGHRVATPCLIMLAKFECQM
jgi:hypothetical protein